MGIKQPLLCTATFLCSTIAGSTLGHDTRIVGGGPIVIDAAPSIVALLNASVLASTGSHSASQFCAGTLIGDRWVLTAAHCVVSFAGVSDPFDINVIANTDDLNNPVGDTLDVIEIVVHEDYSTITSGNDIALLRLGSSVSADIAPLNGRDLEIDELVTAAGWGATQHTVLEGSFGFQSQLNSVDVPAIPGRICNTLPAYAGLIDESMVCAGFPEGGRDSCQGDSGGPLYLPLENGQLAVAGITSFGEGCALENRPGVYTNVAFFVDWIRRNAEEPSVLFDVPVVVAANDATGVIGAELPTDPINNDGVVVGSAGGWLLAVLTAAGWGRRRQTH